MLIKLLKYIMLFSVCAGCQPITDYDGNLDCAVAEHVVDLLQEGQKDKQVWTEALLRSQPRVEADEFLKNWRSGEVYNLTHVECVEYPRPYSNAFVWIQVPRLGKVEMTVRMEDSEVTIQTLILSDLSEET